MADTKMRYVLEAEDRTKAALASAQNNLGAFARQSATFAAGLGLFEVAKTALSGIGQFMQSSVQAALEGQTQFALYAQVLQQASGASMEQVMALKAQAEEMGRLGGVSKDVIMQTQSTLATFDLTTESISELTPALTDLIAQEYRFGATTENSRAISNAFGLVLQGNVGALSRYGFKFDETTEKILKTGTETEKVAALTELLKSTYEGANEVLGETAEGKLRRLNETFLDIKENIGKAVLPAMDLFIGDVTRAGQNVADSTGKNNVWASSFYSLISGVKAAGLVVLGAGQYALAFGANIIEVAGIVFGFAKDVIANFSNVGKAVSILAKALVQALSGDFAGAVETAKGSLNFASTLENTRKAFGSLGSSSKMFADMAAQTWRNAGTAMFEGVEQRGFKPIDAASERTTNKLIDDARKAAGKVTEAMTKALDKVNDAAESAQGKLSDLVDSFGQKTTDSLERHLDRISDFNQRIRDAGNDFANQTVRDESDYNSRRLDLFMGHQDKLADLQERSQDLRGRLSEEEDDQKRNILLAQVNEVRKSIEKEQAIIDQNGELAAQAAKFRGQTDLDRLQASYEAKKAADQKAFDEKMSALRKEMESEDAEYAKQTQRLKLETNKRFEEILSEYRKGYEKIIKESKLKGSELTLLQSQIKSETDRLVAATTSSLGIVSGTSARAGVAAGPTYNFTFNGDITDKETLVRQVVDAVNRATAVQTSARAW